MYLCKTILAVARQKIGFIPHVPNKKNSTHPHKYLHFSNFFFRFFVFSRSQNSLFFFPFFLYTHQVKEYPSGIQAAGATEVRVSSLEEAVGVLKKGAEHRATAATLMNNASSRSHSIFMLRLDQVRANLS